MNRFICVFLFSVLAAALVALNTAATWTIGSPADEINKEATFVGAGMTNAASGTECVLSIYKYEDPPNLPGQFYASRGGTVGTMMWQTPTEQLFTPPSGDWPTGDPALWAELDAEGGMVKAKSIKVVP